MDQRGMTFIEALVWIAVATFAMVALTNALLAFYRTSRSSIQESSAIAAAQHGIDIAVKAIRVASYSSSGQYPIISIAANQMSFYANVISGDPQVQQVRLFTTGTSFREGIIEPSGDPPSYTNTETITNLADNIQNLNAPTSTFIYYDGSGNVISDYNQFAKVRFVSINLIVDASTTSIPVALTLQSSAAMRNLVGQ